MTETTSKTAYKMYCFCYEIMPVFPVVMFRGDEGGSVNFRLGSNDLPCSFKVHSKPFLLSNVLTVEDSRFRGFAFSHLTEGGKRREDRNRIMSAFRGV